MRGRRASARRPLRFGRGGQGRPEPVTGPAGPAKKRRWRSGFEEERPEMSDPARFYITTAIDYPNSRPHIGTAFEKLGADVQARYRRMQGYSVFFLMGNDENTVKVSKRAAELNLDTQAYCDDMARQFQEVWKALDISHDAFVQTSHE